MPEPTTILSFETSEQLSTWLQQNHALKSELWVKIYKKKTAIKSVTWDDVVIECLCWGWIDGIKKSLDDESFLQRITPRKAKSNWSKRNTEHVKRLLKENRMMEPGLVHVNAAKEDGRWDNAYVVSEIKVPDDFINALDDNCVAKTFFDSLTKSNRYVIAHGLTSAKRAETRQRRFDKYMTMLSNQQKPV